MYEARPGVVVNPTREGTSTRESLQKSEAPQLLPTGPWWWRGVLLKSSGSLLSSPVWIISRLKNHTHLMYYKVILLIPRGRAYICRLHGDYHHPFMTISGSPTLTTTNARARRALTNHPHPSNDTPATSTLDYLVIGSTHPANTRGWPNVGLMLGQRRRRWANVSPTLGQRLVYPPQPRGYSSQLLRDGDQMLV